MRKLYILLIALIFSPSLQAQNGWVAVNIGTNHGLHIKFKDINTGVILGSQHYQLTTNGGNNWDNIQITSGTGWVSSIFFLTGITYIGGGSSGSFQEFGHYYKSTNNINWNSYPAMAPVNDIVFFDENNGIIATGGNSMSGSTGGLIIMVNGTPNTINDFNTYKRLSFPNQNIGYAFASKWDDTGLQLSLLFKTTNSGQNWAAIKVDTTISYPEYSEMQFPDVNTGYVLQNNFYKTTNGGQSWFIPSASFPSGVKKFYFIDTNTGWISGNLNGKIYKTTDGGSNWEAQNVPVTNVSGNIYFINELTGWALANSTTILKTGTGGVTSIHNVSSEIPESFRLHQNYPNPFNPETKIKFEIPLSVRGEKSKVRLSVYDVSGKEVQTLVKSELAAGVYEYSFDGTGLGSGVYFYTLNTNNYTETKKMILLK